LNRKIGRKKDNNRRYKMMHNNVTVMAGCRQYAKLIVEP
jgi:hypothetical protein